MPENRYKIYGLNILSSFPLPELLPSEEERTDIKISLGSVPEKLAAASANGALWQSEDDKLLLDIKDAARFLIGGADEIIVAPYTKEITEEIRGFLLGAVLGAVLAARGMVLLRAGAVAAKSGAGIFVGSCGAGKSTMVASLTQKGFSMMADDKVCLALSADGVINVVPAFPQLRLLQHAAMKLNFPVTKAQFVSAFAKFFVKVNDFEKKPAPLKRVYLLAANNKSDLEYVELNQFPEKYEILNNHVYLSAFVTKPQAKMMYFSVLSQAAKQIPMTVIDRPLTQDLLSVITEKIAEDLGA